MASEQDDGATAYLGLQHHFLLERRAARALSAQDFNLALAYADRRCRIDPPPAAHCFVLRAEANWHLGRQKAALSDLAQALSIAPTDINANRRMLLWSEDERRRAAASNLIAHDEAPNTVRSAIAVLQASGQRRWAAVSVFDSHVAGWVAWGDEAEIEATISFEDGTLTSVLVADPFHPLASRQIKATGFRLRRPPSERPQQLIMTSEGEAFKIQRLPPNLGCTQRLSRGETSKSVADVSDALPTIIVPVYGDLQATRSCLQSLIQARTASPGTKTKSRDSAYRILVVNDATPDPELRDHLLELAATNEIDLLINPINLGFVGAINRALSEVKNGDVVLLNADTVVPPGFVERLAAAAHSAPDIGTATPFSNNGDIFSFPIPNQENPMPGYDELIALDRIAAATNKSIVVDVPSGIGFCLYVTRACLDAVIGLSESYERGYLEDVDFCLRARASGFRSVCSASVFVGHHGSRSFGEEKRKLVRRNLDILDQRFPGYRRECLAFEAVDPLRFARATIERGLGRLDRDSVLIATAMGSSLDIARARAAEIANAGEHAILIIRDLAGLRLSAYDESAPQSIFIDLSSDAAKDRAAKIIADLRPTRLEVLDPAVDAELTRLAHSQAIRIDTWITADMEGISSQLSTKAPLLAPTPAAEAFARSRMPRRTINTRSWKVEPLVLPSGQPLGRTLAIVPVSSSPVIFRVIRAIAARLQHEAVSIVVAGATLNDLELMSFPNLFVTGNTHLAELADVLLPHAPSWLFTDFGDPLFGHPTIEAVRQANRKVAYCDWSNRLVAPRPGDLPISPDIDDAALADALASWIGAPQT
ncbi:glycosyltransferase [Bradyrhizobium sp. WSM471]|uniref:glycosyltransferase n=1 Tax=Bradyrhizobium sp. WSM471 TaxID=319017 RepID=UPI00024D22EB|nr:MULTISPECIES: glycosyltransferase [Bradyrhizobium]EHR01420.1 putative glycosyltransferase [Bradyrhizobium sp. WSM471]UFW43478.1 glycosyltransferase [Bradyrhizobium canariense]